MNARRAVLVFVLSACVAAPALAAAPRRDAKPPLRPVSPQNTVRCLADAYEHMSLDEFSSLLSADYVFHFSTGDSTGRGFLNGFDREHEIGSAKGLFNLYPGTEDSPNRVVSIRTSAGRLEESPDPEHPDSISHYRVVVARNFGIDMKTAGNEEMQSLAATEVFYLVRGDVARLVEGQVPLAGRWYIRRWMEDVDAFAKSMAGRDGHCDEPSPAGAESVLPAVFGVRPVDSPLCPTLEVVCDLPTAEPATLEVFDLQGRRLAKQELRPPGPGPMRIAAGSGQRFAPGAYWLRLTQGRRVPSKRLVVVAR